METTGMDVTSSTDQALAFLRALYPSGLWALTAIQPDRRAIETRTFIASQADEAAAWIGKHAGKRNIYFHVNQPRERVTKKAEKADIGTAHYLHVDIDPRAGEPLDAEQARIRSVVEDW